MKGDVVIAVYFASTPSPYSMLFRKFQELTPPLLQIIGLEGR